jgi:hypothetical protein
VVVVARLGQRSKRDVALLEVGDGVDQVTPRAPEAVQAPAQERVTGAQVL